MSKVIQLLESKLPSKKALVVGDACIDSYRFGKVTRISPEAPVPVFVPGIEEDRPGMALNVIKNMRSFGIEVLEVTPTERSTKTRIVDSAHNYHIIRIDKDVKPSPVDISEVDAKAASCGMIVVSDYDKGFLRTQDIAAICEIGTRRCLPVLIDTKKPDLSSFVGAVIKLNFDEMNRTTGLPNGPHEIIVTLGPNGAKWRETTFPTKSVQVHDVCGAGDVFIASFATAILEGNSFKEAVRFANICASISVTKFGTYALNYDDVSSAKNIFSMENK